MVNTGDRDGSWDENIPLFPELEPVREVYALRLGNVLASSRRTKGKVYQNVGFVVSTDPERTAAHALVLQDFFHRGRDAAKEFKLFFEPDDILLERANITTSLIMRGHFVAVARDQHNVCRISEMSKLTGRLL